MSRLNSILNESNEPKFKLPSMILPYLRKLKNNYEGIKERFHQIIINSSILVEEAVYYSLPKTISYSNCVDGDYGHNVILFLDKNEFEKLDTLTLKEFNLKLKDDLNKLAQHISNEYIESVKIKCASYNDFDFQSSVKLSAQLTSINDLSMWKSGYIRSFISHRDKYKKEATRLAEVLKEYRMSSFVAHDNIEPVNKWPNTILEALKSMEVMIVFVTDGFCKSCWTNQEIGFALGRNIPVIPLKFQTEAPQGFISDIQAITCKLDLEEDTSIQIFRILSKQLSYQDRLGRGLIQSFVKSTNFYQAEKNFDKLHFLEKINDYQCKQLIEGYTYNNQLHGATKVYENFIGFLQDKTGKYYQLKDGQIIIDDIDKKEEITI